MVKNFTKFVVVITCIGFISFLTGLLQLIAEWLRILLLLKTETFATWLRRDTLFSEAVSSATRAGLPFSFQKKFPRNSSVVYHKIKDPFWAKICMNTSFQLLVYIMKVKSQEELKLSSLNFSDVMWKHQLFWNRDFKRKINDKSEDTWRFDDFMSSVIIVKCEMWRNWRKYLCRNRSVKVDNVMKHDECELV